MSGRTIRAATDVGGTFTDLVCLVVEEDGRQVVRTAKVDTTPPDFDRGVMDGSARPVSTSPASTSSRTALPWSSTP